VIGVQQIQDAIYLPIDLGGVAVALSYVDTPAAGKPMVDDRIEQALEKVSRLAFAGKPNLLKEMAPQVGLERANAVST
jgi:hypothetical protein